MKKQAPDVRTPELIISRISKIYAFGGIEFKEDDNDTIDDLWPERTKLKRSDYPAETRELFKWIPKRVFFLNSVEIVERISFILAAEFYQDHMSDLMISLKISDRLFCILHPRKIRAAFSGIRRAAKKFGGSPSTAWTGPDFFR